jgi:spermidine synthase
MFRAFLAGREAENPMNTKTRLFLLAVLFFLSGFSSLVIELAFGKYLGYVFGTTAYAVSTVLAAFMLGLSLGNLLGGRLSERVTHRLRWYGFLEFSVGLYAVLSPYLFRGLSFTVAKLGSSLAEGEHGLLWLTTLRFVLSALLVLPPTIAMGISFPLLVRWIRHRGNLERNIGRLYTVNTLGAAIGTLLCTYVVFAALGLHRTLGLVLAINTIVLLGCWWLENTKDADGAEPECEPEPTEVAPAPAVTALYDKRRARWLSTPMLYTLATVSGFITLAYEVLTSHLLATVVGTSTYAFGLVLGVFLLALALGGALVSRYLSRLRAEQVLVALALALLATGVSLSYSMGLWEKASGVFELVGYFKPSFVGREVARALVVCWLIFVPAVLMGLLFPTALCLQRLDPNGSSRRVGITYALNTAGTILGSTVTGFFWIGAWGSQSTMRLLGGLVTVLALPGCWVFTSWRRRLTFAAVSLGCLASFVWSNPWEISRMTSGANIYFAPGFDREKHKIVDFVEDVHGGMTTVTFDGQVHTLMTNGKFEGNSGPERLDQVLFAVIPNLFVHERTRALNIGIGTGQTLKVLHAFGYEHLDAVDISPNVVASSRKWFRDVHGGVFDEPNVKVLYRDGRNHLLLSEERYDLISIELTSIWFASAGNLYSREFYELCRNRLRPNGVLQQWVQLHHIALEDIATIIRTMRLVFPSVELWLGGHQGILIGSERLSEPNLKVIEQGSPAWHTLVKSAGLEESQALLEHRLIRYDQMGRVLDAITKRPERLSTDDSLVLEYSTPRGNVLDGAEERNLAAIRAALDRR